MLTERLSEFNWVELLGARKVCYYRKIAWSGHYTTPAGRDGRGEEENLDKNIPHFFQLIAMAIKCKKEKKMSTACFGSRLAWSKYRGNIWTLTVREKSKWGSPTWVPLMIEILGNWCNWIEWRENIVSWRNLMFISSITFQFSVNSGQF